jgi:hypothetical protein
VTYNFDGKDSDSMIRLTQRGKLIYTMLGQIVLLQMVYASLMLLSALQTLPYMTLAHHLPVHLITPLTDRILHLILLTGFTMGGMVMSNTDTLNVRFAQGLYRAWIVLIIATLLLSGFGSVLLLDMLTAALLFCYFGLSVLDYQPSRFLSVWRIGIILIIISMLAQWVVTDSWQGIVHLLRIYVAYTVTGISMMFWLMTKWSRVRSEWANDGVVIVSILIAVAGFLISIAPLNLSLLISILSVFIVPICYMILAGHSYRALRDRNPNQSLSPHWIAIAVLLWLAGGGFLGTLSTQFAFPQGIQANRLTQAQDGLMIWGALAIVLAWVNYHATELRGENRRVTGYMPLWLIAFGNGFGAIMLGCAGVVEIYLGDVLRVDRTTVELLLMPLSVVWIICLLMVAVGILIYALGFWVRRPTTITH